MIRSHEALLGLIRDYGQACADEGQQVPELLAAIDKTLFDLYDTLERVRVVANIGVLNHGCRLCDEALAIIRGELGGDKDGGRQG